MAHPISHRPIVHTGGDELRSVEMSQVVEPEARQFQSNKPGQVVAVANVRRVDWGGDGK